MFHPSMINEVKKPAMITTSDVSKDGNMPWDPMTIPRVMNPKGNIASSIF